MRGLDRSPPSLRGQRESPRFDRGRTSGLSWSFPLVRLKVEVEPRLMLEFERSLDTIGLATNDHERCHEADDLEIVGKFAGRPDLAVLSFQRLPGARLSVDLCQSLTAD